MYATPSRRYVEQFDLADSFQSRVPAYTARITDVLDAALPSSGASPTRLHEAMRYASLNGGKRLRPLIVYATGECLQVDPALLDAPAAAIEMIHAFSLVHDDLPAMDDDDLRRGKPTCHIQYDEATAILVGDALQTLAFELIVQDKALAEYADRQVKLCRELAVASGYQGMVAGQAIDLASVGTQLDLAALENMHLHKTGALISASVCLAAHAGGIVDADTLSRLRTYARCIGLAFQVQDDILDIEGDTSVIGKTQGADQALNKPTYPALLGMDGAKETANRLHKQALEALSPFSSKADTLRDLSAYIISREK